MDLSLDLDFQILIHFFRSNWNMSTFCMTVCLGQYLFPKRKFALKTKVREQQSRRDYMKDHNMTCCSLALQDGNSSLVVFRWVFCKSPHPQVNTCHIQHNLTSGHKRASLVASVSKSLPCEDALHLQTRQCNDNRVIWPKAPEHSSKWTLKLFWFPRKFFIWLCLGPKHSYSKMLSISKCYGKIVLIVYNSKWWQIF